jgi:hypothetical protein
MSVACDTVRHRSQRSAGVHVKAKSQTELSAGVVADVPAELDEFWCSDCLTMALFERIVDAVAGAEWGCTACGAAYFDAIDLVADPDSRPTMRRTA